MSTDRHDMIKGERRESGESPVRGRSAGEGDQAARPELRVAIVGHRVLADVPSIEAGIDDALRRIEASFAAQPLTILSSLAEGTDRVATLRVLARPESRLIATLPLEQSDYEKDFQSDESVAEFRWFLDEADEVIALPPPRDRKEAYEAGARYLLDHADVVLTVWDGQPPQGQGGTGATIAEARRRGLPIAWVHAGNRKPGTTEPTTLGSAQGTVTHENMPPVVADPTQFGDIPYRIRVGITASPGIADRDVARLPGKDLLIRTILALFDERSSGFLRSARHTKLAYSVLTALDQPDEEALARQVAERLEARVDPLFSCDRPRARNAGRYLVSHCDVLIVLAHSGDPSGDQAPGVTHARARKRPILVWPTEPDAVHLVEPGCGLDAGAMPRLDLYNSFKIRRSELGDYAANIYRDLFTSPEGRRLSARARRIVRDGLIPDYARASLLAKQGKGRHHGAGKTVWVLSPLAVAAVAVSILVPRLVVPAIALELLALLAILVIVSRAHRRRSHETWIECRFLAERLRAAQHMVACGQPASEIHVPPFMGNPRQQGEWMIMAFDEIWARLPELPQEQRQNYQPALEFARQCWVAGQIGFHKRKAETNLRMSERLERWGKWGFFLALGASSAHLIASRISHGEESGFLGPSLAFLAIVLPGIGTALGGFRAHREYSRLAKRSRNMAQELGELDQVLAEAESSEEVARVLRQTEEFMLSEVQDWLMLMRFTKVEAG